MGPAACFKMGQPIFHADTPCGQACLATWSLCLKRVTNASPNNSVWPISLTCLCCKILEHVAIFQHLNQANIPCEEHDFAKAFDKVSHS